MRIQASSDTGRLEVLVEHGQDVHVDLDLIVAAVRETLTDALTDAQIDIGTGVPGPDAPVGPAEPGCGVARPQHHGVTASRPRAVAPSRRQDAEPVGSEEPAAEPSVEPAVEKKTSGRRPEAPMWSPLESDVRPRALELLADGVAHAEVCARLGITRALLARWDGDPGPAAPAGRVLAASGGAR